MCVASDGLFRDLKAITKTVARNMPRKKNARLIKSWGSRGMTADRRIMVEIYDRVQVEDAGKKREQRVKSSGSLGMIYHAGKEIRCRVEDVIRPHDAVAANTFSKT